MNGFDAALQTLLAPSPQTDIRGKSLKFFWQAMKCWRWQQPGNKAKLNQA